MEDGARHDTRVGSDPEVAADAGSAPEPPVRRTLTEPLVAAGAAAASAVLVGAVYPRYPELFPSCPSRTLFGVWCPLCGGTSSASALATGRVSDAIRSNAFVPVLVVLTAWSWLAWVLRSVQRDWLPAVPRWLWTTVGVLWLAYGILRNVPIEPFASLKP